MYYERGTLNGQRSYVKTSLPSLVVTGLIITAGIIIGSFILNKIGFDFAEKRDREVLKKIGGRNCERYVDAE